MVLVRRPQNVPVVEKPKQHPHPHLRDPQILLVLVRGHGNIIALVRRLQNVSVVKEDLFIYNSKRSP